MEFFNQMNTTVWVEREKCLSVEDSAGHLRYFFMFFNNEKLYLFGIFYQLNLTGGRLFK